ncbi:hypothetical protein LCGC14_2791920, partial [marine sediment metagenome]
LLGVSYVDLYFNAVHPDYKRRGCATKMLDEMFLKAHKANVKRFRVRIKIDNKEANSFWNHYRVKPFAIRGDYYLYDVDIKDVMSMTTLSTWMAKHKLHEPIPERSMKRYIRTGAKML